MHTHIKVCPVGDVDLIMQAADEETAALERRQQQEQQEQQQQEQQQAPHTRAPNMRRSSTGASGLGLSAGRPRVTSPSLDPRSDGAGGCGGLCLWQLGP